MPNSLSDVELFKRSKVTVCLSSKMKKRLQQFAESKGTDVSNLLRMWVIEHLDGVKFE